MGAGFLGTFVISWSQTEVDGLGAAPISAIQKGAVWSWRGDAVRVDGPTDLLRLERGESEMILRRKAARMVRKLVGAAMSGTNRIEDIDVEEPLQDSAFVVSDGQQSYTVTLINVDQGAPLLMFVDQMPPKGVDLWVVHHTLDAAVDDPLDPETARVICFTPGTLIQTPSGAVPIEQLREGDAVVTKDNGAQEIQWIGSRRMTGARLFALPKLRPIRIRPGALGHDWPRRELVVSPEHRVLVRGEVARALFNTRRFWSPHASLRMAILSRSTTGLAKSPICTSCCRSMRLSSRMVWRPRASTRRMRPCRPCVTKIAAVCWS